MGVDIETYRFRIGCGGTSANKKQSQSHILDKKSNVKSRRDIFKECPDTIKIFFNTTPNQCINSLIIGIYTLHTVVYSSIGGVKGSDQIWNKFTSAVEEIHSLLLRECITLTEGVTCEDLKELSRRESSECNSTLSGSDTTVTTPLQTQLSNHNSYQNVTKFSAASNTSRNNTDSLKSVSVPSSCLHDSSETSNGDLQSDIVYSSVEVTKQLSLSNQDSETQTHTNTHIVKNFSYPVYDGVEKCVHTSDHLRVDKHELATNDQLIIHQNWKSFQKLYSEGNAQIIFNDISWRKPFWDLNPEKLLTAYGIKLRCPSHINKNYETTETSDVNSLKEVISMLLFRGGIELNPGPGPFELPKTTSGTSHLIQHYEVEGHRLASFLPVLSQVPSQFSVSRLALSGLYAVDSGDGQSNNVQIKCFSCGFTWTLSMNQSDDPIVLHRQQNPNCAYLNGEDHDNVGFNASDSIVVNVLQPGRQTNGTEVSDSVCSDNQQPVEGGRPVNPLPSLPMQSDAAGQLKSLLDQMAISNVGTHSPGLAGNGYLPPPGPGSGLISHPNPGGTYSRSVRRVLGYMDHRLEICRLESYRTWPSNAAVRPDDLANAGFYYLLNDDRVQCAFCRGILRNWEPNDKPLAEHLRHFPLCPFLNDPASVGNVPLGEEDDSIFSNVEIRDSDQAGILNGPIQGIMTDNPVHRNFMLPQDRLATYTNFPSNALHTPEELTRAGFYYTSVTDTVRCFFCDVTVSNWQRNDDPWVRHAQASPRCGYVRLSKGEDFIASIQSGSIPVRSTRRHPRRAPGTKRRVKRLPVDPAIVDELMKSQVVLVAMDMGCNSEVVRKVISRRMAEIGEMFPNPESLTDECNDFYSSEEDEDEGPDSQQGTSVGGPGQDSGIGGSVTSGPDSDSVPGAQTPQAGATGGIPDLTLTEKNLLEETQRLREERICKVCLDEIACIVFLKCGHLVCCSSCAPAMRQCPICRNPILGTIKVDSVN